MYITQAMLWHENKLVAVCVWALSSVRTLYAGSLDDVPLVLRSARDDEEKMVKRLRAGVTGEVLKPMTGGVRCRLPRVELADDQEEIV